MNSGSIKVPNIRLNLFSNWIFKHLRETKSPKLCELTKDFELGEPLKKLNSNWKQEKSKKNPSFARAMIKTIWKEFLIASIIQIFGNIQSLFRALILKQMIDYMADESKNEKNCDLMIAGMIFLSIITILFKSNSEYRMLILTGKIKGLITHIVAEKVLSVNKCSINQGKILNIVGEDLEVFDLLLYSPYLIGTPIMIIISCLLIVHFFHISGLVGIGISILHIPIIFVLAGVGSMFKSKSNKFSDKRV